MGLKSLMVILDILAALLMTVVLVPILFILDILRKLGVFRLVEILWFLLDIFFGIIGALMLIGYAKFASLFQEKKFK